MNQEKQIRLNGGECDGEFADESQVSEINTVQKGDDIYIKSDTDDKEFVSVKFTLDSMSLEDFTENFERVDSYWSHNTQCIKDKRLSDTLPMSTLIGLSPMKIKALVTHIETGVPTKHK